MKCKWTDFDALALRPQQHEHRRGLAFSSFWCLRVHQGDSVLLLHDIGCAVDQRADPFMRINHKTEQGENQVDE
jgi:hypothetical protein